MRTGSCDVVVVGAGAAGMTAAAVAASEGRRVILIEKAAEVGGTTAISGGMTWIPANRLARAAGAADSLDDARRYLLAVLPHGAAREHLETFLTRADEALGYLMDRTAVRFRPVRIYPDYFPDLAGATTGGRVLEPEPFDARALGKAFAWLAPPLPEFTLWGMMVDRADLPHFRRAMRSVRSARRVAWLIARHAWERTVAPRGTTLVLGNALAARLLKSVLDAGVELRRSTVARNLIVDNGRVAGVRCAAGEEVALTADAVVLATGGFSHDVRLRQTLMPPNAASLSPTAPVASGDGIAMACAAGAAFRPGADQNAFLSPVSRFRRADGTAAVFPHTVTDRAKPGFIVVAPTGRRVANETRSYHAFGSALVASGFYHWFLVCDRRALWRYGIGALKPFAPPWQVRAAIRRGNVVVAPDAEGLARALGIAPAAFAETVARYNRDARTGVDTEFWRGSDVYQRHMGDIDVAPNPCVGPIETPPFYAVRIEVGDLGTAAGLATDTAGRVLSESGAPIPGLFACGNDMSSVMEGSYPAPGITLGPAITFGYIVGREAARGPR